MNAVTKLLPQNDLRLIAQSLRLAAERLERLDNCEITLRRMESESGSRVLGLDASLDDARALAKIASGMIEQRQRRANFFPAKMFGEPGWDILLDLYWHTVLGKRVSVSSLCVAGGAPYATGLRWLRYLESEGMAWREPDKKDLRYEWVILSPLAKDQLEAYLKNFVTSFGGRDGTLRPRPDSREVT
jgi:hypothetical protein